MTCFHPRTGFRGPGGMVFGTAGAGEPRKIAIDCGQCVGCVLEYGRQMAVRSTHEASEHLRNSFITLTYDKDNLPKDGSLVKEDWQKFAKRLRHKVGPFKFLMCGEYGDKFDRPHMHALIFGVDFHEDRKRRHNSVGGFPMWTSDLLTRTWGKGQENPIGQVSFESAAYCAKYALKRVRGEKAEEHYGGWIDEINEKTGEVTQRLKKQPEFALMSRKPGLGKSWFDKYYMDVYSQDVLELNGIEMRPPKYYDKMYAEMEPERMVKIRQKRVEEISRRPEEYSKERLKAKEDASRERMRRWKAAQI